MVLLRETKQILAHLPMSTAFGKELYFLWDMIKSTGTFLEQAVCFIKFFILLVSEPTPKLELS